jgi:alanyl-tRNA synthetase
MRSRSSDDIRQTFLDYFAANGHRVVPSSSLLPAGDSTLLFANAGMNQFKDVFAGREKLEYSRAASSQKCVRAGGKHNDLENVGYTARHHTFFEMLGNFSFGDYFKRDAIRFAWELLVDELQLPVDRLWFTVYTTDDEAAELWGAIGAPRERILRFGEDDNFWAMGETGPCGPCSEVHFDRGPDPFAPGRAELVNGPTDEIMEIWNLVFMQSDRDADGSVRPLPHPSIDTGMGLERIAMVLQGVDSNYDTDLFAPILEAIGELADQVYRPGAPEAPAFRVIADHARATTFLMTDGIVPSNEGRGYVLRRIIRRALRYGRQLGLEGPFLHRLVGVVGEVMGRQYPEVIERRDVVVTQLSQEEERFAKTLNRGTDVAQREIERLKRSGAEEVPGAVAFDLYQTHGIPVELIEEFAQEEGLGLDLDGYHAELEARRVKDKETWHSALESRPEYAELAGSVATRFVGYEQLEVQSTVDAIIGEDGLVDSLREGAGGEVLLAVTPFYAESGGQVGDTGVLEWEGGLARVLDTQRPAEGLIVHKVTVERGALERQSTVRARVETDLRRDTQRNHTATHLMHAALREVLGPAAQQAGSLVEPQRFRFDFNWGEAVREEQLDDIERRVAANVAANREVAKAVMPIERAREIGAVALFGEKYGDEVRVVSVGDGEVSVELCGGCHVDRTGDIGTFKIVSERGVAAGVRRIEAVTGRYAVRHIQEVFGAARWLSRRYQTSMEQLPTLLELRDSRLGELEEEVRRLKLKLASGESDAKESRQEVNGVTVLTRVVPEMATNELRTLADTLRQRIGSGVVALGMEAGGKATLLVAVTEDRTQQIHAGNLIKELAPIVGGRGGGRPNLAQAGGPEPARIPEALGRVAEAVGRML